MVHHRTIEKEINRRFATDRDYIIRNPIFWESSDGNDVGESAGQEPQ